MLSHFADATAARDAVIAGRLEDVRAPLLRIADPSREVDMPSDWTPWLAEMRAAAERGARAQTLAEAAEAVSALGTTCGDCHRTTHGGPRGEPPGPDYEPGGKHGLAEKMARHSYAADALWMGITGPVHQEWSDGCRALMNINVPGLVTHRGDPATTDRPASGDGALQGTADPRLPPQDARASAAQTPGSGSVDLDPELRALRELGTQADRATIARDKQTVFSQLIARCGTCHARVGAEL
jgi:cytochrome c553